MIAGLMIHRHWDPREHVQTPRTTHHSGRGGGGGEGGVE